jgi:hypothetical protein
MGATWMEVPNRAVGARAGACPLPDCDLYKGLMSRCTLLHPTFAIK